MQLQRYKETSEKHEVFFNVFLQRVHNIFAVTAKNIYNSLLLNAIMKNKVTNLHCVQKPTE